MPRKYSPEVVEAGEDTLAVYNALSELLHQQTDPVFRKPGPVSLAMLKIAGELAVIEGADETAFLHAARSCWRVGRVAVQKMTADILKDMSQGES